jgi:hypothetical protein
VAAYLEFSTHAFFANTVLANINPLGWEVLGYNLLVFGLFQTGPLLVLAPYMLRRLRPRTVAADLLVGTWVVSLIPLLGMAKEGADYNYWQLFAALSAVLVMLALWERRARLSGALSGFVLGLNLIAAITVLGWTAVALPEYVRPGPAGGGAFEQLVARAGVAPGAVLADPLDAPVLANRSIVLEPVIYKLLYQVGQWDAAPLVQRVCNGEIGLLVLGYPLGSTDAADSRWPRPVLEALRSTVVLHDVVDVGAGQRFVYVPQPGGGGCVG